MYLHIEQEQCFILYTYCLLQSCKLLLTSPLMSGSAGITLLALGRLGSTPHTQPPSSAPCLRPAFKLMVSTMRASWCRHMENWRIGVLSCHLLRQACGGLAVGVLVCLLDILLEWSPSWALCPQHPAWPTTAGLQHLAPLKNLGKSKLVTPSNTSTMPSLISNPAAMQSN
jgi:hypothetical protein